MDRIEKALAQLTKKEREAVRAMLARLHAGGHKGLDIKKLKGRNDIFRVRKGDLRIIYRIHDKQIFILAIERKSEKTYKF